MKKFTLLILLVLPVLLVKAQKESGTVYSEHESIAKTKALWESFVKGDKAEFCDFFADTVDVFINGERNTLLKEKMGNRIDWWKEVEQLTIKDDTPATPDALHYSTGQLWVQDWLRVTGIHKNSGVVIDWPIHNLYSFNKEGKIRYFIQYFNNDLYEEINNSGRTIENGVVYIHHPYISSVRKLINAICSEDIGAWKAFFDPKVQFYNLTLKYGESKDLATRSKELEQQYAENSNIRMKQFGYPDCIYYAKDDSYVVYSWWIISYEDKNGVKREEIPILLTHVFNKEGKIVNEVLYNSSNHFE